MSFWNSRNVKKTRKKHICMFCGAAIPVGSTCSHESGLYGGEMNDYYLCNRCHALLSSRQSPWVDPWDNTLGEFTDCLMDTDAGTCPKCGKPHYADFDFADDMLSAKSECDHCGHIYIINLSAGVLLREEPPNGEG